MRRVSPFVLAALVLFGFAAPAAADPSAVKIGVLTDLSGAYADAAGRGSVVAAELAVEEPS